MGIKIYYNNKEVNKRKTELCILQ